MRLEDGKECLVCDHCRHIHFPEPDADGVRVLGLASTTMCSVCRIPLIHASIEGRRLLHCERCRGLLIAVEVFVGLIERLRARDYKAAPDPTAWGDINRPLDCPACGNRMDTHPYGGPGNILIDNCPQCELNWLDHSELSRIATSTGV